MQLTGKQYAESESVMESAEVLFEKSPKAQVRRPTRPEHVVAFEFLKIHYEEDIKADTPIQKSDVYADYETYCVTHSYKPLVAADFGRILKSMFPNARDRRLGSRGSSKYCYVGVKRKSESNTRSASQNPYSAEDLANAYQTVICEWASTVLSRRMASLEDLAKYLLRNRFVQTRSCAALTITASLKDTDDLTEPVPMNKHRETQLKLQEKLREKLFIKQHSKPNGFEEAELHLAQRIEKAFSSNCTTPEPEGQMRNALHVHSESSSMQTSPEHHDLSVASSACTSPVFADAPRYCMDYSNGYSVISDNTNTPIHSQCNSAVSSARNTPILHHYPLMQNQLPYYPSDPRIQSCPNTPLPGYQPQRFDFSPHFASDIQGQQCASLPSSNRNTPCVDVMDQQSYYNGTGIRNGILSQFNYPSNGTQQRNEFSRNNSTFIPIKEDGNQNSSMDSLDSSRSNLNNGPNQYISKLQEDYVPENNLHNDSDELEINELLNIINTPYTIATNSMMNRQSNFGEMASEKIRPMSAQSSQTFPPLPLSAGANQLAPSSNSGSVIYDLLKSRPTPDSEHLKLKLRHSSGPQLGYNKPASTLHGLLNSRQLDLCSPPPPANFRPVSAPNKELRLGYGDSGAVYTPVSLSSASMVSRALNCSNSVIGTMSPPSQPLSKRKRQNSGEAAATSMMTGKPASVAGSSIVSNSSPTALADRSHQDPQEYANRRNLSSQLSSSNLSEISPKSDVSTISNGHSMMH